MPLSKYEWPSASVRCLRTGFFVAIAVLLVTPATASDSAAVPSSGATISPQTDSSADKALLTRGLLVASSGLAVQPPAGTEVDEYLQTDSNSGQELVRYKQWQETLNGRTTQIQLLQYPTGQRTIVFWLMQPSGSGCVLHGSRTYNSQGEEISSSMWRNDPGLKIPGAVDFPPDLLPGWVPPIAFIRALDASASKSEGTLHVQATSYGFATLAVWRLNQLELSVGGGNFHASKLEARTDIKSVLPSWPSFVLKILQPLIGKSTFYFEADAPYRLLKIEGPGSLGGPDTKTELVRHYNAGT